MNPEDQKALMEAYADVRKLALLDVASALERGIEDYDLARPAVLELRFIIKALRKGELPYQ